MNLNDIEYGELLDLLRKDLQLNLATDALPGTLDSDHVNWAATPPRGTTFPSPAVDGQVFDLVVDATNGYVWRFRYRAASASTFKWEFVGGVPVLAVVATLESQLGAVTTYAALTTAGPSFTVPRAGDYNVDVGSYTRGTTVSMTVFHSFDIGATGAVDANGSRFEVAVANDGASCTLSSRLTGLAANTALVSKYRSTVATIGAGTWGSRWMRVTPIRCS